MNQRLLSGAFVLAISLALVGAAVTGRDVPVEDGAALSSAPLPPQPVRSAQAAAPRVALRSGSLDTGTGAADDAEAPSPAVVRIGSIGLEAPVLSVGVDENNQFDVPEAQSVGWYRYGAAPGQAGSTVLAAHVDYDGRPGAFFDLAEVEPGELLEVELSDGAVHRYRVIANVLYDKTALPADELFRKGGDPVLQLITCGGTFDPDQRSYRGNVVVTAEPVEV